MIGTKLYKNKKKDMAKYTEAAIWCNSNNAYIDDKGSYYEVCENVGTVPTKEEQLATLDAQYEAEKALLMQYFNEAQFAGDTEEIENLKTEKVSLDDWYIAERKKIEGSEE